MQTLALMWCPARVRDAIPPECPWWGPSEAESFLTIFRQKLQISTTVHLQAEYYQFPGILVVDIATRQRTHFPRFALPRGTKSDALNCFKDMSDAKPDAFVLLSPVLSLLEQRLSRCSSMR